MKISARPWMLGYIPEFILRGTCEFQQSRFLLFMLQLFCIGFPFGNELVGTQVGHKTNKLYNGIFTHLFFLLVLYGWKVNYINGMNNPIESLPVFGQYLGAVDANFAIGDRY